MVKKRRRPPGRPERAESLKDLEIHELDELRQGHSLEGLLRHEPEHPDPGLDVTSGQSVFPTEGHRRREWERHRHLLLAGAEPGTRPWAWWRHESPDEPRREVLGEPYHGGAGIGFVRCEELEPERVYLERHGLLSAGEKALLAELDAERAKDPEAEESRRWVWEGWETQEAEGKQLKPFGPTP